MHMKRRWVVWGLLAAAAVIRPGVDLADRALALPFWNVPSQWNAVADVAIKTGVVDGRIDGAPAPWRQASVVYVGSSRVAIVTVSDLHRSRATFLDDRYHVLGGFERVSSDPSLATDETRGYKPLTHYWPLVEQDHRLLTLIAFAPQFSNPPNNGLYAYLAVGEQENELLFVCRLRWGAMSMHGMLARTDLNGDGLDDLAVYPRDRRDAPPLATFIWDPKERRYRGAVTPEGVPLVSWWSTAPDDRVVLRRDELIDPAALRIDARFAPSAP